MLIEPTWPALSRVDSPDPKVSISLLERPQGHGDKGDRHMSLVSQIKPSRALLAKPLWLVAVIILTTLSGCGYFDKPTAGPIGSKAPQPIPQGKAIDGSQDVLKSASPTPAISTDSGRPAPFGAKPVPKNMTREELLRVAERPAAREGYQCLSFNDISNYPYREDKDGKPLDKVPDEIKKLDKQQVAISGFMVPLGLSNEGVKDFILIKNQMLCCFGQPPKLNEWVLVRSSKPLKAVVEIPIVVLGSMQVGEEYVQGQLASLYRLQAETISEK